MRLRAGSRRVRLAARIGFFLAAASTALPLFAARYVPIQDLPQHVAAVRVLFDYDAPGLGFRALFERTPFSTQYLSVYLAAGILAKPFGALLACKLVLALTLIATPYALRLLLVELRRPTSTALLALPLAYSVHFVLGFLNFLAGLPLLFAGLALAARLGRRWSLGTAAALAAVALACFYTHVVPYALLVLGAASIASIGLFERGAKPVRAVKELAPLAPSALATLLWLFTNPAGAAVATLVRGAPGGEAAHFAAPDQALRELPDWLTDALTSDADEIVLVAWALLALTLLVLAAARRPSAASAGADARIVALRWRVALWIPLVWLAYFVAPASYAFIWPINARFPLIALLVTIAALPRFGRAARAAIAGAALGLSALSTHAVYAAFQRAGAEEYAGLSEILGRMPEGKRVAGLIFARGSRFVRFSPYLHAAAWYQAERGGAVMFSFADFAQSPFRFRDADRPPRVPPRWEWMPERVDARSDLAWFDYVLKRGGPRRVAGWNKAAERGEWSLWARE